MKFYRIDFEQLKEYELQGGVFLLDRMFLTTEMDEKVIFYFISSNPDSYTVLAANFETVEFAKEQQLEEEDYKQDRNVKINEVALEVLKLSRSLVRQPGDEDLIQNNSDLVIELGLTVKEIVQDLIGLPYPYIKQFLRIADNQDGQRIKAIIRERMMADREKF